MKPTENTEPVFTWEESFPKNIFELFFDAVKWSLPNRPPMPPTIATKFRLGEFAVLEKMGIQLQELLHGEQEYSFYLNLKPDTKYLGEVHIKNDHEKKGKRGSMRFLAFQTDLKDMEGNLCVQCVSTVIHMKKAEDSKNG